MTIRFVLCFLEFEIFEATILSTLSYLIVRYTRISNRVSIVELASLLFSPRRKTKPRAFVNGNIEKSYKFGAVYPQNFTFFQYRVRVSVCIRSELTPRIRKIRIYI